MKKRKKILIIIILLFILIFISLFLGRYKISPARYYNIIKVLIGVDNPDKLGKDWSVFYFIRLPRVILVAAVGMALSVTGAAYQSMFRNPLVSPDILGVTAGASFGVALGMFLTVDSLYIIYLLAFIFGITAVFITYAIARHGKGNIVMMMVLSGIIVSSLFNAMISLIKYIADPYDKLPGIVFYLMGGFNRIGWEELKFTIPIIFIGLIMIYFMRWYLNVMAMGDEEALSLGINVKILRIAIIIITTFMVAVGVATTGQVTWIGLIVPHIARSLIGTDHRFMLPAAGLTGALLLLIMDNLARTLTTAEIPISIITAFVGAPFFAYLLIKRRGSGWA